MGKKTIQASLSLATLSMAIWAANVTADPNVKFITPADGDVFNAGESVVVKYAIKPNPGGDHSHIYVNNKETGVLRRRKGKTTIDPLPAGEHSLCLKVVNKGHASIGQGTCIKVSWK